MHDDLRLFHTYDIKRTKKLKFSTGGQYLVAATDKHIILLSTYGLEQLCKLDSPSQQVTALAFNQDDSILSFMSADGFHQRYDLVGFKKRGEAFIDRTVEYRDVCFLGEQGDLTKCVSVGMENRTAANIRIFNKEDNIERSVVLRDTSSSKPFKFNGICLL